MSTVPAFPRTLSVALWAANLEPPVAGLSQWLATIETRMAEAQAAGMHLLALPELACMQWLSFAPPGLAGNRQLAWLAALAGDALPALRALAARYGVALLAGTTPFVPAAVDDGRYVNRAWLLLPDGRAFSQDKLFLTPSEQDPSGWMLTPGTQINVVDWGGLRIAIVICLDVEATALWARLARLDLDLILVPAKTDRLSGYYRVFGCAKARAIELQTVVCVVGAVGTVLAHPATDTVVGGAAAYIPCDAALDQIGVAAALEPQAPQSGLSPMLYAPHLPVGYCRQMRHGAAEAEVCPGAWSVDHVALTDPAPVF